MAKGLNKHTPDSEELLKRLNSNDSGGLDDFEKEALEGFDSLDNTELAKNLTDSLNKKIDEKYFQKESGGTKKGMMYLSLAAGLVLVVGLSIFFMNIMGDKKEMAMEAPVTSETVTNNVADPTDLSAPPSAVAETEAEELKKEGKVSGGDGGGSDLDSKPLQDAVTKSATGTKDIPGNTTRAESQPNDDGLTPRMVLKEKKAETNKTTDAEMDKNLDQNDEWKSEGPPSMVVDAKQKTKEQESDVNEKTVVKGNANSVPASPETSTALATNKPAKESAKEPAKKSGGKDRKKSSDEHLGNEDAPAEEISAVQTNQAVGGVAGETKRDESGYVHNLEYSSNVYSKPQDYLKVEISKSEMLKTNVKAFKAELTISEKGIVTGVNFLTPFNSNCPNCKKELEKILLNMPGWKASASKKAVKETVSYIDQ